MKNSVLRPLAEGFRDSINLWKEIVLALLSVFSVIAAFVNGPRSSEPSNGSRHSR